MKKNIGIIFVIAIWAILSVCAWILPSKSVSEAERRKLAQFPDMTSESVFNGKFTSSFETYTLDQFPLRDKFRQCKAIMSNYVFRQKDNNDIYIYDGVAVKMEPTISEGSIKNANKHLQSIYDKYLKKSNCKIYFSIVPDKAFFLSEKSGHISMNYDVMFDNFKSLAWAQYIDITQSVTANNYYKTDTHWKQEEILSVAQILCDALGTDIPQSNEFTRITVEKPFYGVYYGQAALPMSPDEMYLMNSIYTEKSSVFDVETNQNTTVYNDDALNAMDLYDYYLGGAKALLIIENPEATSDKELVIFRDSFGSSLTPLMLKGYSKITVVDTRYMSYKMLGNYIKFNNQDVLFIYSTSVLNKSYSWK